MVTKECEMSVLVESVRTVIAVAQVIGCTLPYRFICRCKTDSFCKTSEAYSLFPVQSVTYKHFNIPRPVCPRCNDLSEPHEGSYAPPVEYGGPSILSAESLMIHSPFPDFFTEIHHERCCIEVKRHIQRSKDIGNLSSEEIGAESLLVMIFQKVQHIWLQVS